MPAISLQILESGLGLTFRGNGAGNLKLTWLL